MAIGGATAKAGHTIRLFEVCSTVDELRAFAASIDPALPDRLKWDKHPRDIAKQIVDILYIEESRIQFLDALYALENTKPKPASQPQEISPQQRLILDKIPLSALEKYIEQRKVGINKHR